MAVEDAVQNETVDESSDQSADLGTTDYLNDETFETGAEDLEQQIGGLYEDEESEEKPDESAETETTEKPDTKETPVPAVEGGHDETLLQLVEHTGLGRQQVQSWSREQVVAYLNDWQRTRSAAASQANNGGQVQYQQQALPELPDEYQHGLNPEEHDPAIIAAVDGLNRFWGDRFNALVQVQQGLYSHLASQEESRQRSDAQAYVSRFEHRLNSLGAEYEPLLGKGTGAQVSGSQLQNRQQLFQKMNVLRAGYAAQNLPVPSEEALQAEALNTVFGANIKQKAAEGERLRIQEQARNRKGQFVAQPAPRRSERITDPRKRAVAKVGEQMAEMRGE